MTSDISSKRRERARVRKAVRKHIHKYGQPRDNARDLLEEADGSDGYEKTIWLKAQRAALDLHEKMESLISRQFVAQRLSEIGRLVQDSLEKIPARIAHDVAAERSADKVRTLMENEIRGALSALADALDPRAAQPADAKKEQRKGHRGVRRSRPLEIQ